MCSTTDLNGQLNFSTGCLQKHFEKFGGVVHSKVMFVSLIVGDTYFSNYT